MTRTDPRRMFARAKSAPRSAEPVFEVRTPDAADARTAGGDVTKVYLYEPIGLWFGVTASQVVEALADIETGTIELHVNSPGGDAYEGIAIANVLRQHEARVVAIVDGLAASAASMVIMGADEVVMAPNSELMIHDASTFSFGTAAELAEDATRLDKLSHNYSRAYAAKAGGEPAAWRDLMVAETWYLDEEAVAAGLADRVLGESEDVDSDLDSADKAMWDLAAFAHAGRAKAPAPRPVPRVAAAAAGGRLPAADKAVQNRSGVPELLISPAASAAGANPPGGPAPAGDTMKEESMPRQITDEQFAALAQQVGVAADADLDTALAAVTEALAEQAEDAPPAGLAPGTRVVDQATYDDLLTRASRGDEAAQAQAQARREAAVDTAVAEGKIPPSRRQHWLTLLTSDEEGTSTTLASLAAGTVPLVEQGHGDTVTDDDKDFAEYNALGYGPEKKED